MQRLISPRLYITASYNNTSVTLTDSKGNVIAWCTSGSLGFKGPKKATPFAASKVVETLLEKIGGIELDSVSVFVQGVGSGRDSALRAFASKGIDIRSLHDITPIPHNGCRPRKARRV
ncbi:MAG: 30S ribosomal protein S11 [Candidatus Spechtbacteria bacterium RIFCSPHIGHO2_02_FULL_43_15b]|uniref:Small ribosomal subunit protein uS11 n=1 Tax=Candidatus Spechtbacteria bacterium RIFCSPHIGHO2_01_FULL_43_30 TaxID=1802158 RepID=A0A1G2H7K4_9BACT|nr:MAG: 30S ribosomal protein S11 [Candidatus Spechtbacteria bacterium RIFCSPHIGHO2_01_FULL_43_30]OGZ59417.1 MAG: 30S ribosomal protein S11 [Candidatus Spechtbacteria bacterium RIFCSPHIGHO2_02_FULL_43_15b]